MPKEIINDFYEVCMGYSEEEAASEASRCLQCKQPKCVDGCPVNIDIPVFIRYIKNKNAGAALETIMKKNYFPGVCGRVCPQEKQCEALCVLSSKQNPIKIGRLERFAADNGSIKIEKPTKNGKKIAVVGSGPAGLSCAASLASKGYAVTIFESLHAPGGVLIYGIPAFRLPKNIVEKEIGLIKELGIEIKTDSVIGNVFTIEELLGEFCAVFIGTGAGLPYFLHIPGENLVGICSANEFLTRVNLMNAYHFPRYETPVKKAKKTIVVGGGNVAIDAARVAKRLGSDVTVIYRRSLEEMSARKEEIDHAKEEGIKFMLLTNPICFIGEKKIESVECIQMMLSEKGSDGRREPTPIEGTEFTLNCDQVIIAVGQAPNPILIRNSGLKADTKGNLVVDDEFKTSKERVFAGGDAINGEATVIKAMGDGKKAAQFIDNHIKTFINNH